LVTLMERMSAVWMDSLTVARWDNPMVDKLAAASAADSAGS
jgi:hypothetical protein